MNDLQASGLSEKGRRKTNQDAIAVHFNADRSACLLVLADGMGGYEGGELASQLAVSTAMDLFDQYLEGGSRNLRANLKEIVKNMFFEVQQAIAEKSHEDPVLAGMGTTLCLVLMVDHKVVWGSLGDSRIYMTTQHGMDMVTRDHSLIQDYMDKNDGRVPVEYLQKYSNVLLKSVSGNTDLPDIYPDDAPFYPMDDQTGFLLCSDGLILDKSYDYSGFFYTTLHESSSPGNYLNTLYNWAYQNGSTDNISVIYASFASLNHMDSHQTGKRSGRKKKRPLPLIIISSVLLLTILMAFVITNITTTDHHPVNPPATAIKHEVTKIETVDKLAKEKLWTGFRFVNRSNELTYSQRSPSRMMISWQEYPGSQPLKRYELIITGKSGPHTIDAGVASNMMISELAKGLKAGHYTIKLRACFKDNHEPITSENTYTLIVSP